MELRVSSLKRLGLSTSDCASDPEEKEVSDEDDDDRNHKHRRRDSHSQSMERDAYEPVSTRPFRKRNRLFDNGHPFRENESQDYTTKFEKRRPGPGSFPQRIRPNQPFSGDLGSIRGRGRDPVPWGPRDPRFNQVDLASGLFAGRGLPNVSNPQSGSWNGFGLIPGIPNGGLDTLHTMGLQGTLAPAVNSSLNMRITRQRCRDFEERGFCLRGDMCPMEHGVNRIVVEDVQSLSQFNLPVSLPSAQLVGTHVPGSLQGIGNPSTMSVNSKAVNGKITKSGLYDDNSGLNGGYSGSGAASGADFYDPDQPLWNNNGPETSNSLLHLHSPKNNETDSLMSVDPSDQDHAGPVTGSSVWGRIGGVRNRREGKERMDSTASNVGHKENGTNKEEQDTSANPRAAFRSGKQHVIMSEDIGGPASANKPQGGKPMRVMRKPSQKALRTIFVAGIPQKSNRRETLLSHFHKFGEIIDIYIPSNSDRAFIQFSKMEEAEAALMAPDAVMGNRFIKLWWANRDSIPDDGVSSSNSGVSLPPRGTGLISVPPHPPPVGYRGKDFVQSSGAKVASASPSDASTEYQNLPNANSPKAPPPVQKKLEQLKEELRKKQEMLDQKRNDFRRQLDKLQKQTTVTKGEISTETPKKPKVAADAAKATAETMLSDPFPSPNGEMRMANENKSAETVSSTSKISAAATVPEESSDSKWLPSVRTVRPIVGSPCLANRYKLDNRPTTFRIIPPLPAGLANVDALKEHFSTFGNLTSVELESAEPCKSDDGDDDDDTSKITATKLCFSAHVSFATRFSAETAFVNGKTWQGHDLQFTWVASTTTSSNNHGTKATTPLPLPDDKAKKPDSQEALPSETNGGVEKSELSEPPQSYPTEEESVQDKPALNKVATEKEASSEKEEPGEGEDGC